MKKIIYLIVILCIAPFLVSCSGKKGEPQKWEYMTLEVQGDSYSKYYPSSFHSPDRALDKLGKEGWELVSVYTQVETVHPNFGNDRYVTGIQPNTRTCSVFYVFKRPLKESDNVNSKSTNSEQVTEEVAEETAIVEEVVVTEDTSMAY